MALTKYHGLDGPYTDLRVLWSLRLGAWDQGMGRAGFWWALWSSQAHQLLSLCPPASVPWECFLGSSCSRKDTSPLGVGPHSVTSSDFHERPQGPLQLQSCLGLEHQPMDLEGAQFHPQHTSRYFTFCIFWLKHIFNIWVCFYNEISLDMSV